MGANELGYGEIFGKDILDGLKTANCYEHLTSYRVEHPVEAVWF
jgi:hypothetical protein